MKTAKEWLDMGVQKYPELDELTDMQKLSVRILINDVQLTLLDGLPKSAFR